MTTPVRTTRTIHRRLLPLMAAALAIGSPVALTANAYAAAVTSEVVRYPAVDDAYVSSSRPTLNTGASERLMAGRLSGDSTVSYLKFTVAPLAAGARVAKAQVRLTRDEHHLPGTVKLSTVSSSAWSESTLTKSLPLGSLVDTQYPTSSTVAVVFDVTTVVKGPGTYAFAITSPATNDVARFRSGEYAVDSPALELTVERPAPPLPAGPCVADAKLVPSCGVLWGAAAGGFTTTPGDVAVRAWEQASGRTATVFHMYHRGDQLFPTAAEIAMAREAGKPRVLMLNWQVAYGSTWAKVTAGEQDARIDREAAYLKSHFTERFFLLIHHEPENDVDPAASSGMTAKDYAAMFRHTVQRLRAKGVTNAVSVVAYMNYERWMAQSWWGDLYPGDDVVDWIGSDSYVSADPNGFHHGDFAYLANRTHRSSSFPGYYTWATTKHPTKPFMLAEWGVFDYAGDRSQKAAIYDSVLPQLKNMPAIKAMMYFDAPNPPGGGDTRIDSSPQALAAFKKIAADPIFNVKLS